MQCNEFSQINFFLSFRHVLALLELFYFLAFRFLNFRGDLDSRKVSHQLNLIIFEYIGNIKNTFNVHYRTYTIGSFL